MRSTLVFVWATVLLLAPVVANSQPTDEEIQASIDAGLTWLAGQQQADGSWYPSYETVAHTCFALIKFQDRAYELGYESPFVAEYPYSAHVLAGWQFVLQAQWVEVDSPLAVQVHGAFNDDPDVNANGYGIFFDVDTAAGPGHHSNYSTGVCLMALASSGTPDRPNDGGLDFGAAGVDTYLELAQDAAEWLAFGQGDLGNDEGGWGYYAHDNGSDTWTDNSNSGYVLLGLASATGFGVTVPDWVARELDFWITTIQVPVTGSLDDGGSYYNPDWLPNTPWVNELKGGNLIFQMTYFGDDPSVTRFQDALDYIVRWWQDPTVDPGWGYSVYPADYQAMFGLMKGFEFSGIDLIDLDGDLTPEHDWFGEFATVLVDQQNADGSWPSCNWGNSVLCTVWSLLTLEKISPPPPAVDFNWDMKFCSNPNAFNCKRATGKVPLTIFGSEDLDVTQIDLGTLVLALADDPAVYIGPIAGYEMPVDRGTGDDVGTYMCTWDDVLGDEVGNPDGYDDLNVTFLASDVSTLIGCSGLGKGDTSPELVVLGLLEDGRDLMPLNTQVLDIKK